MCGKKSRKKLKNIQDKGRCAMIMQSDVIQSS